MGYNIGCARTEMPPQTRGDDIREHAWRQGRCSGAGGLMPINTGRAVCRRGETRALAVQTPSIAAGLRVRRLAWLARLRPHAQT